MAVGMSAEARGVDPETNPPLPPMVVRSTENECIVDVDSKSLDGTMSRRTIKDYHRFQWVWDPMTKLWTNRVRCTTCGIERQWRRQDEVPGSENAHLGGGNTTGKE